MSNASGVETNEDILGMSDEEFLKRDLASFVTTDTSTANAEDDTSDDSDTGVEGASEDDQSQETDQTDTSQDEGTEGSAATDIEGSADGADTNSQNAVNTSVANGGQTPAPTKAPAKADKVISGDANSFMQQVTAPFKANGVEMQISDPAEVISLMQMGLNYQAKMQALAEPRRLHKMLSDAGVADEGTLGYLIDLHKKNPEAIAKLVKESGVDLYSVDDEAVSKYTPQTVAPHANVIAVDDVLKELESHPFYDRTLIVAGKDWDDESKQLIVQNPLILKDLASHMQSGVFDQINTIMVKERAMGRLNGMSDYNAFMAIGNTLYSQGQLKGHTPQNPQQQSKPVAKPTNPQAEARRRQAAPPSRTAGTVSTGGGVNYLAMSDAEFMAEFAKGKI